jgi:hypothetical protein
LKNAGVELERQSRSFFIHNSGTHKWHYHSRPATASGIPTLPLLITPGAEVDTCSSVKKSGQWACHQKLKKGIPAPSSSRVHGILSLINVPIPLQFFQNLVMRIIDSFLILNHPERLL